MKNKNYWILEYRNKLTNKIENAFLFNEKIAAEGKYLSDFINEKINENNVKVNILER